MLQVTIVYVPEFVYVYKVFLVSYFCHGHDLCMICANEMAWLNSATPQLKKKCKEGNSEESIRQRIQNNIFMNSSHFRKWHDQIREENT
jgi:hypothetical protein